MAGRGRQPGLATEGTICRTLRHRAAMCDVGRDVLTWRLFKSRVCPSYCDAGIQTQRTQRLIGNKRKYKSRLCFYRVDTVVELNLTHFQESGFAFAPCPPRPAWRWWV